MKIILAVLLLCIGVFTINTQTHAQILAESESNTKLRTHIFGACDWWTQIPDSSNGYGCQFRPTRIEVPNASDLEQILSQYESRINQLETRVKALEDAAHRP